ncbi:MAG: DUF4760 domain-containing protein [Thermoplasmatota archaeon]
MTVPEILPYFQLASSVGIVAGASFAGYQLWRSEQSRKHAASLATVTSFNTQEFRNAFATVYTIPLGASAEEVRAGGPEMEAAATTVMMTFEMMGVLVFSRMVTIETVDQAVGGFARESWRRLENYVAWKRKEVGSVRWGEWYQWMVERLATHARRATGAYEAFRDWKA